MRQFDLKVEKIEINGNTVSFNYGDVLTAVLGTPDAGRGFSIEQIARVCRVTERLKSAGDAVVLEEDDWSYLVAVLKNFRWGFAHPIIIELVGAVENAEEIENG